MLHRLKCTPNTVHWGFYDGALKPVITLRSGDTVEVETLSGDPAALVSNGVRDREIPAALKRIHREVKDKGPGPHILTGPIRVEGAETGDVLEVEVSNISLTVPYGYNSFTPTFGTLPEDYPYTKLKVIRMNAAKGIAEFSKNIQIPLSPFLGQIGVAPPAKLGRLSSAPPGFHGGNMDNKELTEGAKIFLPVHVKGALLSVGDTHAVQGDGEVDLSALETCATSTLQVRVRKDLKLRWPLAETKNHIVTMGFDIELLAACKMALRNMIDFLMVVRDLDRDEAYMLSSLIVDLHVTQLVDGVRGVHALIAKNIFSPPLTVKGRR